jgi:hypothetical protein
MQRITQKEAGGGGINQLVVLSQKKEEDEEEFASCSYDNKSIRIWRRGKGGKEMFKLKQRIPNVKDVVTFLYISHTNELIFASDSSSSLLQIWSTSSSSSSDFVEIQKIQTSSSWIRSLCQISENRNDDSRRRIEFASGHSNGQIMIWSKQQQINGAMYSSIRTLKPFDDNYSHVNDLIFLNDKGFDCLISCSWNENKIVVYKNKEEKEELDHVQPRRLIPMSNGQFASGGHNQCLNIWSPSSSSSP